MDSEQLTVYRFNCPLSIINCQLKKAAERYRISEVRKIGISERSAKVSYFTSNVQQKILRKTTYIKAFA